MENALNPTKREISGYTLKMIALVTMFIDHTAAIVLYRALSQAETAGFVTAENFEFWLGIYDGMRNIGRMAFPIYCFLLVEGFHHTKDLKKYILRLFLFALISEIPFDLAFNSSVLEFGYNNVFFTLWIGLLVIAGLDFVRKRFSLEKFTGAEWTILSLFKVLALIIILLTGMYAASYWFSTDYAAAGVVAIAAMYLLYQSPMIGFALGVMVLGIMSDASEYLALLMLIPLYFYNGTRGKQVKYLFYGFYPVHLLLLVGIAALLGLQIFY